MIFYLIFWERRYGWRILIWIRLIVLRFMHFSYVYLYIFHIFRKVNAERNVATWEQVLDIPGNVIIFGRRVIIDNFAEILL